MCTGQASASTTIIRESDVNPHKYYIIYTMARGGLTVRNESDTRIWGTYENGVGQEVNSANPLQHFAFVNLEGRLYLYSVATRKYVSSTQQGELTDQPSTPIYFENSGTETVRLVFDESHNINLAGSNQVLINSWNIKDAGNSFYIMEVGDFPADVLCASDVRQDKCYIIHTETRGGLTVTHEGDTRIWGTKESGVGQEVDADNPLQHFAFVKKGEDLCLYSVGAHKFVSSTLYGELTIQTSTPISFADAGAGTVRLVFDENHNINLAGSNQVLINSWNIKDAGNSFCIEEAGDFSSDVLREKDIKENKCYIIHTLERGGLTISKDNRRICNTNESGINESVAKSNPRQHFAFIKQDRNLYLYSVEAQKFVSGLSGGLLTEEPSKPIGFTDASEGTVRLTFGNDYNINLRANGELVIDAWYVKDPGNSFYIMEAGDFSLVPTTYTITATSADAAMGTASGGGTYEEGQTVTLTATPKSGYRFVKWSDGTTANPYTFKATKDVTLTATFEKIPPTTYTITVTSANTTMGTVSGGGTYEAGQTVTLTATPYSGYRFVKWSSNRTDNPYIFKITTNIVLTACFEAITYEYTVKLVNAPKDAKLTIGGKSYADGDSFTSKKKIGTSDVRAQYPGYSTKVEIINYVIIVTYTKTTDSIEAVTTDDGQQTVAHDLTGRILNATSHTRGVSIVNGKKIIR